MQINGVEIIDTYAEAFPIWFSRIIITADDYELAKIAATEATGFSGNDIKSIFPGTNIKIIFTFITY